MVRVLSPRILLEGLRDRVPAPLPSLAPPRPDRLGRAAGTVVPVPRGGIRADSAGPPAAGVSSLACCPPGPARSTRKEAADVHCGIGPCGVPRPSLADYVRGLAATPRRARRRSVLMLP